MFQPNWQRNRPIEFVAHSRFKLHCMLCGHREDLIQFQLEAFVCYPVCFNFLSRIPFTTQRLDYFPIRDFYWNGKEIMSAMSLAA